jgi:GGDEF domain-containing protein
MTATAQRRTAICAPSRTTSKPRHATTEQTLATRDPKPASKWRAGVDLAATADRMAALRDRQGGASDRSQARDDRCAAASDRALSASEREVSSIDQLTGANRRDTGIFELARETDRAKRTEQQFVLAFVDVDDLKATNDALGHIIGDKLLRYVADAIRAHVRSCDLIVRFGGDELSADFRT